METSKGQGPAGDGSGDDQYSLAKILTIWAVVAVPMPILAFVVAPAFAEVGTMRFGLTFWFLMIGGMMWQFVVSMVVLAQEGSLRSWTTCPAIQRLESEVIRRFGG